MKITLPEQVKKIIEVLKKSGHEAYAVGGCVRDSIMGRIPADWDITTSASPYEVKELFRKTVDTGLKHGTVTVLLKGCGYEVTTYRLDGIYEDKRHPKQVEFTDSLREDLRRRDFTINAMAYNEEEGLVDLFEGLKDLERKMIRCVGNSMERFEEDALRILRALRFSAQFGFEIEEETKAAMKALAGNLSYISEERIQVELIKLLTSPHPDYLRLGYELSLTKWFFPEFDRCMETPQNNPHHCYCVGEHTLCALSYVEEDRVLRLAVLLHDIGKPVTRTTDEKGIDHFYGHEKKSEEMAEKIMRRLKMDNRTISVVKKLIRYHDWSIGLEPSAKMMRRKIAGIGEEAFPAMFAVNRADILAQNEKKQAEKLEKLKELQRIYEEIIEKKNCLSLKTLEVKGKDLIEAGITPGKELGAVLQNMLTLVIDEPEKNDKKYLIKHLADFR